jgi:hypothetical protein
MQLNAKPKKAKRGGKKTLTEDNRKEGTEDQGSDT